MMQRMQAEILYLNPDHVDAGVATLVEYDFSVTVLDLVDPCGPTIWIKAGADTELTPDQFFDLERLVNPDGDVVGAGLMAGSPLRLPTRH